MLADLLQVPVAVIRRWHRRGLIVPARQVRRLPYFDFQEVATARRLAELLSAGQRPRPSNGNWPSSQPVAARHCPAAGAVVGDRRRAHLLVAPGRWPGRCGRPVAVRLRCRRTTSPTKQPAGRCPLVPPSVEQPAAGSPAELCELAATLEDNGHLEQAVEAYRAALAAGGPRAETCFQLAELLYRLGDVPAACERYYMAVELDEDYVEARANLGCVLAETGRPDLADCRLRRTLRYHGDYPDAAFSSGPIPGRLRPRRRSPAPLGGLSATGGR